MAGGRLAKVLVVDDERNVRLSLVYILFDAGYDVIEAEDGAAAVQKAVQEQPDLVLLDVMMPVMDGFQVLTKLQENPATEAIPVILLTALPPSEGEQDGMKMGVSHYITKPWDPESVELIVKLTLRHSERSNQARDDSPMVWAGSTSYQRSPIGPGDAKTISLGEQLALLQKKMGGGLASGSMTMIEGATSAGTSVLGQHMIYGALEDRRRVVYFTSQHTPISLAKQMGSIGLPASKYIQDERLCVFPVEEPALDEDCEPMLAALALDIRRLPKENDLIVVDAITTLANHCQDDAVVGFFSDCKRICSEGKTIVIVVHSYALNENVYTRLGAVCDAHLKLRVGKLRDKVVRVLEVVKANAVELNRDNTISFEVEAGSGMRIIPFSQAKV